MTAIRRLRRGAGAAPTLVVFPHAGGSANFYRHWADTELDVEIIGVQYPGRADRLTEPCSDQLTKLADELVLELTDVPGGPTTFLGHSLGAIVAYEVARRREAAGEAPVTLVASASMAPGDPLGSAERDTSWDDDRAMESLIATGQIGPDLFADHGLRRLVLPYLRADYEMLQRYEHVAGPPLRGDILAVTGADDPDVTAADAVLWREFTSGRFRHVELPGGHFYLAPEPPLPLFLRPFS